MRKGYHLLRLVGMPCTENQVLSIVNLCFGQSRVFKNMFRQIIVFSAPWSEWIYVRSSSKWCWSGTYTAWVCASVIFHLNGQHVIFSHPRAVGTCNLSFETDDSLMILSKPLDEYVYHMTIRSYVCPFSIFSIGHSLVT